MPLLRSLRAYAGSIEGPVPLTSTVLLDWLGGKRSAAGVDVSDKTALGVTAFWRGLDALCGTVADCPVHAIRDRDNKDVTPRLFSEPHPFYTWPEWMYLSMWHRVIYGDAYTLKVEVSGGDPGSSGVERMLPLNPTKVSPILFIPDGKRFPTVKMFDVTLEDGQKLLLDTDQVMHIPGLHFNGLKGRGVVEALRDPIGGALATDRFAGLFFGSGTLTSGFLKTEKKLRKEDAEALKERWQAKVAGVERAHEIAVLDSGASYESLTIPPEQAQFLETRNFNVLEMARALGVPPHILYYASDAGVMGLASSPEAANTSFVQFSLRGHLGRYEARFTKELLPRGTRAKFNTAALMRGDLRARWGAYLIGRKSLSISVNEIRREEGLTPVDDPRAEDPLWPGEAPGANMPGGNEGEPPPDGGGEIGKTPGNEGDSDERPNEE